MSTYKLYAIRVFSFNWEESLSFYRDVVGFPLTFSDPDIGWAQFELGPAHLGLERCDPDDDEANELVGRFVGISIEVEDIAGTYDRLLAQGVEFMEDFIDLWGLSTKVDAADVLGIDLTDEEHGLRGDARKFYEKHEDDPRSRIIAELISRPEMKAEVATDVLCEAILRGWDLNDAEGRDTSGMSVNDLVNAVTYVHQTKLVDAIVADQMAHAGGALLRQLVTA